MAQAALAVVSWQLKEAVELLEGVHRDLPPPPDLADRQEGRKPYDVTTDVLATIECVLADDLRPAVEALQRSSQVTDSELEQQYREWLKRESRS
jgi:arginine utilization protein RocB